MGARVAQVLIMAAVLIAMGAVAVWAQSSSASSSASAPALGASKTSYKQCFTNPCHGSARNEVIYERIGDRKSDRIYGYGGNDRLHANTYTKDRDQLYGYGGGADYIYVNDGDTNDAAVGGKGFDYCYVDAAIEAANTCDRVIYR